MVRSRWLITSAIAVQFVVYYLGYQHGVGEKPPSPVGSTPLLTIDKQSTCNCSAIQPLNELAAKSTKDKLMLDEIFELRKQYQSLKDSTTSLSEEEKHQLPDMIKHTLNQLPIEMVASRIEKYTKIPAEMFQQMPDQQSFVNRLSDIAMEGIITEPEESQFEMLGPIVFSNLLKGGEVKYSFSSIEVVVFAQFDTATYNQLEVFVKWYRVDDGKVFIFEQMPISQQSTNVIWLTDQNGLEPGNYQVAIFDVSPQMNLLSQGSYTVVNYE